MYVNSLQHNPKLLTTYPGFRSKTRHLASWIAPQDFVRLGFLFIMTRRSPKGANRSNINQSPKDGPGGDIPPNDTGLPSYCKLRFVTT
jgi:hypothetical protein